MGGDGHKGLAAAPGALPSLSPSPTPVPPRHRKAPFRPFSPRQRLAPPWFPSWLREAACRGHRGRGGSLGGLLGASWPCAGQSQGGPRKAAATPRGAAPGPPVPHPPPTPGKAPWRGRWHREQGPVPIPNQVTAGTWGHRTSPKPAPAPKTSPCFFGGSCTPLFPSPPFWGPSPPQHPCTPFLGSLPPPPPKFLLPLFGVPTPQGLSAPLPAHPNRNFWGPPPLSPPPSPTSSPPVPPPVPWTQVVTRLCLFPVRGRCRGARPPPSTTGTCSGRLPINPPPPPPASVSPPPTSMWGVLAGQGTRGPVPPPRGPLASPTRAPFPCPHGASRGRAPRQPQFPPFPPQKRGP